MSINERIFEILETHTEGQANLARYLGINQSNITSWKNRKTDPPAKYLIKICEFLNISLEYLLGVEKKDLVQKVTTVSEDNSSYIVNDSIESEDLHQSIDEKRVLEYYRRLSYENRDIIKGEMIHMYKEQESAKSNKKLS